MLAGELDQLTAPLLRTAFQQVVPHRWAPARRPATGVRAAGRRGGGAGRTRPPARDQHSGPCRERHGTGAHRLRDAAFVQESNCVRLGPCPRGPRGGASARRRGLEPRPVGGACSTSGSPGYCSTGPAPEDTHRVTVEPGAPTGSAPGWCRDDGGSGSATGQRSARITIRPAAAAAATWIGCPGSRREAGSGPLNFRAESGSWA